MAQQPSGSFYRDASGALQWGTPPIQSPAPAASAQQPPAANPQAATQQPPPATASVQPQQVPMPPPPSPLQELAGGGGMQPGPMQDDVANSVADLDPTPATGSGSRMPIGGQLQPPPSMTQQPGEPPMAGGSGQMERYQPAGGPNSFGVTPQPGSSMPARRMPPPVTGTGSMGAGPMGGSYGQQPAQRRYMPQSQGGWGAMGQESQQQAPANSSNPQHNSGSGFALPPDKMGGGSNQQQPMSRYRPPQTMNRQKPTF